MQTARDISEALKEWAEAFAEIAEMERGLNAFLDHYYQEIGEVFLQTEKAERELKACERQLEQRAEEPVSKKRFSFHQELEKEVKQIYRRLSKKYHPDAGAKDKVGFHALQQAYLDNDLPRLLMLDKEAATQDGKNSYEAILHSYELLCSYREEMKRHPAFQLQQKAFQSRLLGVDFIEEVKQRAKIRLQELKLMLIQRKAEAAHLQGMNIAA